MNAVIDRDVGRISQLLDANVEPNSADRDGWTALHYAAQNNDTEIVTLLLERGASPLNRDSNGNTPLFRAVFAYRGGPECITALLSACSDPDAVNDHGVSPRALANTIANYDTGKFFRQL